MKKRELIFKVALYDRDYRNKDRAFIKWLEVGVACTDITNVDSTAVYDLEGEEYPLWNVDLEYIRQYTGFEDKNGVKIFEVDILKHDLGEDHYETEVVSDFNSFIYAVLEGMIDPENCIIIGNTFSNPELETI